MNSLTRIDQHLHKLSVLDHFDTYVNMRGKEFSKRVREIIATSDVDSDQGNLL